MFITKVSVSNGTDGADLNVESTRTLRSLFEEADVPYRSGLLQLNGEILDRSDLDTPIGDLVEDPNRRQVLRMTAKAENAADAPAATAVITGSSMVITSTATPEEIRTMKRYRPSALKLFEEHNGHKEQIFMVTIDCGPGSINANGAVFSDRVDKNGKATITIDIPESVEDVKAWAADTLGVSILMLRRTEKQFADNLEAVKAEKKAVDDAIVLA